MQQFSVNTAELSSAGSAIQTSMENISAQVTAMLHQLFALQNSWQGSASNAFREVIERWKVTQTQVEDSLTQIRSALVVAQQDYEETESRAVAYFN